MNASIGLALDATTIFVGTAWGLSFVGALAPLPAAPAARTREALRLALLPVAGGMLVVAAAFWPSLVTWFNGVADHCVAGGAHPHLCWLHATEGPAAWHDGLMALLAATLLLAVGWRALTWARAGGRFTCLAHAHDERRAAVLAEALRAGDVVFPGPVWVVPADRPWCFVAGVRRPTLVVASSVVDALAPADLLVAVAHEAAHVRRGDTRWRLVVDLAGFLHAPGLGRRAARRWADAAESACDEAAAATVGSRLAVAEALVRFQRLVNGAVAQPGIPFGGDAPIEARVKAVLDVHAAAFAPLRAWPWVALALLFFQADGIHEVVEAVLGALHG